MTPATPATTDLSDEHPDETRVMAPIFRDFGGRTAFCGAADTLRVHEDNARVRAALEEPGKGKVLVVDGGASLRCALVGGKLGALAEANGWAGIVVNGCVRDTLELAAAKVGVKALAAHPRKSGKTGAGERGVVLRFADVTVSPGDWVYADADGVLVAPRRLHGLRADRARRPDHASGRPRARPRDRRALLRRDERRRARPRARPPVRSGRPRLARVAGSLRPVLHRLARWPPGLHRAARPPAPADAPRARPGGRGHARRVASLHGHRARRRGHRRRRAGVRRRAPRRGG